MPEVSEDLGLLDSLLSLFLTHMVDADFFDDQLLSGLFLFDEVGLPECTLTKQLTLLIELIFTLQYPHFHLILITIQAISLLALSEQT